ncbi:MAG TPA: hemolysin family protein [Candidatus Krumholzibacterium sp.]|nr:hemolysin family protein [Candidatus Krumholzibacterium sp.]
MDRLIEAVSVVIVFFLCQAAVSGGLVAFAVLARMQEDRAFPRETRGRRLLRLMHRERLHLVLILILLQAVIIILATIRLPGVFKALFHPGGADTLFTGLLPTVVSVLLIAVSFIAGAGLATRRPVFAATVISWPVFPLFIVLRPVSVAILKLISIAFPDLPAEIALPLFLFPGQKDGSEGFIEKNGSMLVHSIVEFGEKKVREVMVPRIDVFAIDNHADMDEIRQQVAEAGHSRVPIYDTSIDRITGILCVKDLVNFSGEADSSDLKRLSREPFFVPEGKKIEELLREFQRTKKHLAIVVDEYGGTSGIVTLEDILEEIVGEIRDEHDDEDPMIREAGKGLYLVEGRINLDELDELLDISLPSEQVDTLGGFLFDLLGRVPDENEEVQYEGISFKIEKLEGQRISEVLIRVPDDKHAG